MTDKQTKDTIEVKDVTQLTITAFRREYKLIPKLFLVSVSDFMGEKHNNIGIQLYYESKIGLEPYITLTKNFGEYIGMKFCAYVDTNNCRFTDQLLKQGIAVDTGFTKQSGFCTYPLWQFNEKFLKAVDEAIYERYSEEYDKYMEDEDPLLV